VTQPCFICMIACTQLCFAQSLRHHLSCEPSCPPVVHMAWSHMPALTTSAHNDPHEHTRTRLEISRTHTVIGMCLCAGVLKIANLETFTKLTQLQLSNNVIERIDNLHTLVHLTWLGECGCAESPLATLQTLAGPWLSLTIHSRGRRWHVVSNTGRGQVVIIVGQLLQSHGRSASPWQRHAMPCHASTLLQAAESCIECH